MNIEKLFKQSGAVPFRKNGKADYELLIIKSRKNKRWIIPKGIIENGYNAQKSAKKEALEEAGVEGKIIDVILGHQTYIKWGGECKVVYYPLKVKTIHEKWEEDFRKRKWIQIEEVSKYIKDKQLIKIINNLKDILSS